MKRSLFFVLFSSLFITGCTSSIHRQINPNIQAEVIKYNYNFDLTTDKNPKRYTYKELGFEPDTPKSLEEARNKYPDHFWRVTTHRLNIGYPKEKSTGKVLYFQGEENSKKITYQLATTNHVEFIRFKNIKMRSDKTIAIYIPSFDEISYVCMSQGSSHIEKGYFTCATGLEVQVLESTFLPKY